MRVQLFLTVFDNDLLSEAGDLELIPELGNYPTTAFSESQESIQLATYGKKFGISRQAIINDDLDAFSTIPARMGRAAARKPTRRGSTTPGSWRPPPSAGPAWSRPATPRRPRRWPPPGTMPAACW